jgi:acetoin utilization deacetylase AcuC-like enzyme
MSLDVTMVWSPDVLRHVPGAEIWVGVRTPGTETPQRAEVLRSALAAAGAREVTAVAHPDALLDAVHDPALTRWLREAWDLWVEAGFDRDPGQDRVVPYLFATPAMLDGLPGREPVAVHARAGYYCYDTMTLVGPGTWEAARAAVDVAATAAELAWTQERVTYALCRPPGHHATRSAFGGSCYLNNTAVAVEVLQARGARRVAVVDLDAHHGNGTQALFYDRADVFYGSVHVDPGAGWFPHVAGFADEKGRGDGIGTTLNCPLPPGTGDDGWLAAVREIRSAVSDFAPDALVVSLGLDAARADPESPLEVTEAGYHEAGKAFAGPTFQHRVPTVAVQEGGYDLDRLGALAVAALDGLSGSADR